MSCTHTLLPAIRAECFGFHNERHQGNVLLDSGLQISLIREAFADKLKLQGKNTTIVISKVGGETEEIQTKIFKMQIDSGNYLGSKDR